MKNSASINNIVKMHINDMLVVVLEDDPIDQIKVKIMLSERISSHYTFRLGGIFTQLQDLLMYINNHKVDLVLSDIMIENKPIGIELVKTLQNASIPIILMTASQDQGLFLASQKYLSVHYLIKPFHAITLQSAIEKTLEAHQKSKQYDFVDMKYLYLSNKSGHQDQVWFTEIIYIEADDSHCYIHTPTKKYVLKKSLSKVLGDDLNDQFIRIHHKYAVNKLHIRQLETDTVQVTGLLTLPVGRSFKKGLKSSLKHHID
jgi:DNA-binding LytR/AlgR family response regulator